MEDTLCYTPTEVARKLGVRSNTVYILIHQGEIPAIQFGKRYKIPKDLLDEWMKKTALLQMQERKNT